MANHLARSQILFGLGTIEEKVQLRVEKKVHDLSLINDGDLDPLFA